MIRQTRWLVLGLFILPLVVFSGCSQSHQRPVVSRAIPAMNGTLPFAAGDGLGQCAFDPANGADSATH